MKYANTRPFRDTEIVVIVLPLSMVPQFDPEHPPQADTYGVADDVEVGWVKQLNGTFLPPVATLEEVKTEKLAKIDFALRLLEAREKVEASSSLEQVQGITW